MDLNYRFIGNPESERIIVFLHEGLGSIKQWKDFPAQLCTATDSYGLVYDRSGYGESKGSLKDRQANYLHLAAQELSTVIQKLIPTRYRLFLYGHSDGGSIALIYAAEHPNKPTGIITEAAHVFVEKETLAGVKAAQQPFKAGKFDGLKKFHGDRFEEVFLAWNNIWLHPSFHDWNITALLPKITCPQLIMQGKNDQYGTLQQIESIKSLTAGNTVIFTPDNCGHAPHKEKKQDVLTKTTDFILSLNNL